MTLGIYLQPAPVPHALYVVAFSYWWIVASAIALSLMVVDWRTNRKRLAVAVVVTVAGLSSGAGTRPPHTNIEITDPCTLPPISEMPWWERLFMGCP